MFCEAMIDQDRTIGDDPVGHSCCFPATRVVKVGDKFYLDCGRGIHHGEVSYYSWQGSRSEAESKAKLPARSQA